MGIPFLYDLRNEVMRLSIAGSGLSIGDYGLKKILPQVRAAAKSAPVFGRMADTMENLIDGSEEQSSEKLLELLVLLNAVLYTQGQADVQGDLEEIRTTPVNAVTKISYRNLVPVIESLRGQGSGRLEVVREAYFKGFFDDMRLILFSIEALDDTYNELSGFILENVLPKYGMAVLPIVKNTLDLSGGKGHAKRIELISNLAGFKEKDLYIEAIEKGSQEVKISAIKALSGDHNSLDLLLDLTKDKKKEVREAALYAVSYSTSDKVIERLYKAFCGRDCDIAAYAIRNNPSEKLAEQVLEEAQKLLEVLEGGSPKPEDLKKFSLSLLCLEGKNFPIVFDFLKECMLSKKFLYTTKIQSLQDYGSVQTAAKLCANTLLNLGNHEALLLLEELCDAEDSHLIAYSFEASLRIGKPDYVFEKYSPYITPSLIPFLNKQKNLYVRKEILSVMENLLESTGSNVVLWDSRWAKTLVKLDEEKLIRSFIEYDFNLCTHYLAAKVKQNQSLSNTETAYNLMSLHRAGYPGADDLIIETLKKTHAARPSYYDSFVKELLMTLPSEYAGEVEEVALMENNYPSTKKMLFEAAQYIKNKDRKE